MKNKRILFLAILLFTTASIFAISYGKNLTVKNCSLNLEKGEICSIVGESGSGKTVTAMDSPVVLPVCTPPAGAELSQEGLVVVQVAPPSSEYSSVNGTAVFVEPPSEVL